jgi:8-oxo-dGTP pyrophosphatase MutT (NUDIX family)
VLLRDRGTPEVFLVKRHDSVAFMGGAHVFPGGSIDSTDHLDDPELICDGVASATARRADVTADAAIAFHVAAVRELFEEAGVLLARRDGAMVSLDIGSDPHWQGYRRQLAAGVLTMPALAARESLRLALDALACFAHWVTPEIETRRFDTRFFAAVAPEHQQATHDDAETTHGEWMSAADAIARCHRGEIMLPPPTWTTLRQVERFASVADVMAWARTCSVPRVQPGFIERDETRIAVLPGDPECPPVAGFEAKECRFVLEGGRWRTS